MARNLSSVSGRRTRIEALLKVVFLGISFGKSCQNHLNQLLMLAFQFIF